MSFSINLGNWNSIFVVPTSVVDQHIKLAGAAQLKVLLWMLRNSEKNFAIEDLSAALGMHPADAKDATQYWVETGIISKKENTFYPGDINKNEEIEKTDEEIKNIHSIEEKKDNLKTTLSRPQKPDSAFVATRILENPEVSSLMQEAQVILGRPISNGDSSTLLMLHDYYGLPVDVIIMVLQYAMSVGKANMRYVESVGISWAIEEIDTLEKAENKLIDLDKKNKAWNKVEKLMGLEHRSPTSKESEMVNRWINDWNYKDDMIKEAYERCVNAKGKYIALYIDSIIKRWNSLGIYTIDKANEENKSKSFQKDNIKARGPSYDIDEYEKCSIFDDIDNRKRDGDYGI